MTTGIDVKKIKIGMSASFSRVISDEDIKGYAVLSGDFNPIHLSDEYAENSRFKKRIAHGLLPAGFFSTLFGEKLPGPGCIYVSQSLQFKKPVYINDEITASVEVVRVDLGLRRVFFRTVCRVKNIIVIDGEAEIFIPS